MTSIDELPGQIGSWYGANMCNLYDIGKGKRNDRAWVAKAVKALEKLPKRTGIRKTDKGLVIVKNASGELEPQIMRWGFHRAFNPSVNNTRSDKLESAMWAESFQQRRCLIPVMTFYEWTGPQGHKQTYRFDSPDEDWLWVAGIWESSQDYGLCYSMITTDANEQMAPIHERMPAVLRSDFAEAYLGSVPNQIAPTTERMLVQACVNPLKKQPEQGELFGF